MSPLALQLRSLRETAKFQESTQHRRPHHGDHSHLHNMILVSFVGVVTFLYVIIPLLIVCIKRKDGAFRFFSLYMYLVIIAWMAFITSSHFVKPVKDTLSSYNLFVPFMMVSYGLLVISYLFVFIESFCSEEMQYLLNVMEKRDAIEYLKELKDARPQKLMKIRLTKKETYKMPIISNKIRKTGYSRLKPANTASGTVKRQQYFKYKCFRDLTTFQKNISDDHLIRLTLSKLILFGSAESMMEYQRQRDDMIYTKKSERNARQDVDIIFKSKDIIPNFKQKTCIFTQSYWGRPCWLSKRVYVLAIILGFSWPYRLLFGCLTSDIHITVCKELLINDADSQNREGHFQNVEEEQSPRSYTYEKMLALQSQNQRKKQQQSEQTTYEEIVTLSSSVDISPKYRGPTLISGKQQLLVNAEKLTQENLKSLHIQIDQPHPAAESEDQSERRSLLSNKKPRNYVNGGFVWPIYTVQYTCIENAIRHYFIPSALLCLNNIKYLKLRNMRISDIWSCRTLFIQKMKNIPQFVTSATFST